MKNGKENILPVSTPPLMYLSRTTAQLAVGVLNPTLPNWMYTRYVQLDIKKDCWAFFIDFPPNVHSRDIPREEIRQRYPRFSDYAAETIDRGRYIFMWTDTYPLSPYANSYSTHFRHELLIYGYRDGGRTFCIADFFDYRRGFQHAVCSGEELDRSFESYAQYFGDDWPYVAEWQCDQETVFSFDRQALIRALTDYRLARNERDEIFPDNVAYSIAIYSYIRRLLESLPEKEKYQVGHGVYSILPIHKHFMQQRLQFLRENHLLAPDPILDRLLTDLVKSCEMIKGLFMKYNATQELPVLKRIADQLTRAEELDIRFTERLITALQE